MKRIINNKTMGWIALAIGIACIATTSAMGANDYGDQVDLKVVNIKSTPEMGSHSDLPLDGSSVVQGVEYDFGVLVSGDAGADALLYFCVLKENAPALDSDFVLKYWNGSAWEVANGECDTIGGVEILKDGNIIPILLTYNGLGDMSSNFWVANGE